MKARELFLLSIILVLSCFIININVKAADEPFINATSAVLMDLETGQVLFSRNMHIHRPPASLTKILTAIIAIEEGNLEDPVKVSRRAAYQEGSSIWLKEGEIILLEELLFGVMLASGNDASVAVAEHISGSIEEFANLMNKRAKEMGAINSNFLNPSGLPQTGHYSTAYDLAIIMRYALHNKIFAKITATKYKTISWAGNDWGRGLRNHNELLWSYPGATGGKTGYTRAAGRCLITSARKNERELIAVTLNSANDWMEVSKLLDYGLNNFYSVNVINKGELIYKINWEESRGKILDIIADSSQKILIPEGKRLKIKKEIVLERNLKLPIRKGDYLGKIDIYQGEQLIVSSNLKANNDLNYNSVFLRFWYWFSQLMETLIA
jgi:serine-type D-Ala-D-Ala carboxypeptidase (penicillin-binding protein 5/6)